MAILYCKMYSGYYSVLGIVIWAFSYTAKRIPGIILYCKKKKKATLGIILYCKKLFWVLSCTAKTILGVILHCKTYSEYSSVLQNIFWVSFCIPKLTQCIILYSEKHILDTTQC